MHKPSISYLNQKNDSPPGLAGLHFSFHFGWEKTMLNKEFLQDLSARITRLLPMAAGVRDDVEKSVRDILQSAFSRLNLVTREEFDAQLKVLARAEQTIAALEEKIARLETMQQVNPPAGGDSAGQ